VHDVTMSRVARPIAVRTATGVLFFALGIGFGVWATQIPRLKANLGLSDGALSVALLSFALGAILLMPVTGWVTARLGSRIATIVSSVAFGATMGLLGLAPSLSWLVAATLVAGAASGAMDVAMNTHATATERAWGAPIMSSFHGFFSLGGLLGAAAGGGLIALDLSAAAAMGVAGLVAALLALSAAPFLRLEGEGPEGGHAFAWPTRAVLGIGMLTFLCLMMEGAVADWSAVYLRDVVGASLVSAGLGYAAFSLAMMVCRFAGDGIVRRFGRVRVVGIGGGLAALGFILVVATPWPFVTALGFGLVGLGLANLVPVLFSAAGDAGGMTPGVGVAMAATVGYAGFMLGPPVIGLTAEVMGLRAALALLAIGAACTVVFARAADDRRST
jgi:MFS family permease